MIVFLFCVKTKRDKKCRAAEMYTSDLFIKSLQYAKSLKPRKIYILSALYGLLELTDEIEPYNKTLVGASDKECKQWAFKVYKQMEAKHIDFNEETIWLCGYNYRKYLITKFTKADAPLKNLGIQKQLGWYKNQLNGK